VSTIQPDLIPTRSTGINATHIRYGVMAFLCILSFLSYFDRVCIMRVQGDIKHDLSISNMQMGWIMMVFWFAYALFELPGGWLGDRYGARNTLTRIVLAWSLFTALSGSAVGFYSLFAYRFLFGVGEAGAFPNMARVQARWLPLSAQGKASGVLWLVARWGGALSMPLFGYLLAFFSSHAFKGFVASVPFLHGLAGIKSWRMSFWACGLMGITWVVFFYPWFRDNPADKPSVNQAELDLITAGKRPKPRAERDGKIWAALFTSPDMWALAFLYVFGSFGFSFFITYVPNYLFDNLKIDIKHSEWMSAAPLFCGGATCLIGGILSDKIYKRLGRKRLARAIFPVVGHIIAAAAILGLRYVHSATQATILLSITMAAYDFGLGAKWATIIDIGGRHSGLAAGFVNMIGNLGGNCLQPILAPWIIKHYGWPVLFGVYSSMYLLAASTWFFIHPDRHFYKEDEGPRGLEAVPARA